MPQKKKKKFKMQYIVFNDDRIIQKLKDALFLVSY